MILLYLQRCQKQKKVMTHMITACAHNLSSPGLTFAIVVYTTINNRKESVSIINTLRLRLPNRNSILLKNLKTPYNHHHYLIQISKVVAVRHTLVIIPPSINSSHIECGQVRERGHIIIVLPPDDAGGCIGNGAVVHLRRSDGGLRFGAWFAIWRGWRRGRGDPPGVLRWRGRVLLSVNKVIDFTRGQVDGQDDGQANKGDKHKQLKTCIV